MKLTHNEIKTIIKNVKNIGMAVIEIALVLEGALQGYYGGKLDEKK